jgi:hypothetical protein
LDEPVEVIPVLRGWVRWILVAMAVFLVGIFAIALYLDPYAGGKTWTDGTHTQLGLQACQFKVLTGKPCPSCGMTTSFALLVRGDVWDSLRANAVGTLLALGCMLFVPWGLYCAVRGRLAVVRDVEPLAIKLVVGFLVLMLLRWAIVLWWTW